jgi:hypothetical protein
MGASFTWACTVACPANATNATNFSVSSARVALSPPRRKIKNVVCPLSIFP